MSGKNSLGNTGESLAAQYLEAHDYTIITKNWRCRYGEIDIVAEHNDVIVFIEVKTRRDVNTQNAFASIDGTKQGRFIKAVQSYIHEQQLENIIWRIDAIGIAIHPHREPIIDHVEDALGW